MNQLINYLDKKKLIKSFMMEKDMTRKAPPRGLLYLALAGLLLDDSERSSHQSHDGKGGKEKTK